MRMVYPTLSLIAACRVAPPGGPADTSADTSADTAADTASDSGDSGDSADSGEDSGISSDPLVFIADNDSQRYTIARPSDGAVVWELDLSEHDPEFCHASEENWVCGAYGAQHRVEDGQDLILATYHAMDIVDPVAIGSRVSRVEQLRLTATGAEVDWRLDSLDFSQHYSGQTSICAAETACTAPTDSFTNWRKCSLVMAHDVELVEQREDGVVLVVADTINSRVLRVRLPVGETCGVVEDVLSAETTEGWGDLLYANDVDQVRVGSEAALLVTHKGSMQDGSPTSSRGKVTMWTRSGRDWTLTWQLPAAEGAYLSAPHNADLVTGSDGESYVVYAHGGGLGAGWEDESWGGEDQRGSIGVARLSEEGRSASYLADVGLGSELGFLRDVDRLSDGSWLVTDSGCKGSALPCTQPTAIWHLDFAVEDLEPAAVGGGFSADHSDLVVVEASNDSQSWTSPLDCDLSIPYEADLVDPASVGAVLRAALDDPMGACGGR